MKATGFHWVRAENHLPQAMKALRGAIQEVVTKAVLDIQAGAQAGAPFQFGQLRSSIQPIVPDAFSDEVVGGVGSNVFYAAYQELGTGAAGAGSPYPYPRRARYTSSWPGIAARAFMAESAKRVEGPFVTALGQVGRHLPGKV